MLEFTENMGQRTNLEPTTSLTLTWEQRGKCRQRLRLDSGEALTIVDVRTPAEFREGHIAGAVNMDFFGASFDSQILTLPKDKPILLYCRTGNRSAGAYDTMTKEGLTNILHMNQGITAWQQSGLPLQK